jgi:hypothetical protein
VKPFLKSKWVVPAAALIITLSIGSAAFAATGASSTAATSASATSTDQTTPASAPAGSTATNPWGNQRSDETLLTGTDLTQVQAVALAQVGSDATIVRVETDSDASLAGHAAYEVHAVKADGTPVTVYVDKAFNYVSTETQQAGSHACGGHAGGPAQDAAPTTVPSDSTATSSN